MKVEDVRNAPGNTVCKLAGHAVFGDRGQTLSDAFLKFAHDVVAHGVWQGRETRACLQVMGVLRKIRAHHCQVMPLSPQGIAEDHRRAVEIHGPLGIAVVLEGCARAGDGPLL